MTIKIGDRLPDLTLARVTAEGPKPVKVSEEFKGKTVVLFAVPGAFTPTCTARHLPGFVDNLDKLKAKGVDEVACIAVNDPFVMAAWAKDHGATDKITMFADGNAEFTKALGLDMDASAFGMGTRSQRYAMLVKDGVVKLLDVEQGGEFRVSSAEHMLAQL